MVKYNLLQTYLTNKINDNALDGRVVVGLLPSSGRLNVVNPQHGSLASHLRGSRSSSSISSLKTDTESLDKDEYNEDNEDECINEFFYDDEFTQDCFGRDNQSPTQLVTSSNGDGFGGHQLASLFSNGNDIGDDSISSRSSCCTDTNNSSISFFISNNKNNNNNNDDDDDDDDDGSITRLRPAALLIKEDVNQSGQSIKSRMFTMSAEVRRGNVEESPVCDMLPRYHGDNDDLVLQLSPMSKRRFDTSVEDDAVGDWRANKHSQKETNSIKLMTCWTKVLKSDVKQNGIIDNEKVSQRQMSTWSRPKQGTGGIAVNKSAFTAWNECKVKTASKCLTPEASWMKGCAVSLQSNSGPMSRQEVKSSSAGGRRSVLASSPAKSCLLIDHFTESRIPLAAGRAVASRAIDSNDRQHVTNRTTNRGSSLGHVSTDRTAADQLHSNDVRKQEPLLQDSLRTSQSSQTCLIVSCCGDNRLTTGSSAGTQLFKNARYNGDDCRTSSTTENIFFVPHPTADYEDYRLVDSGCCSGKVSTRNAGSDIWSSSSTSSSISIASSIQSCHSYVMSPWRRLPDMDFIEERLMQPITSSNYSLTSSGSGSSSRSNNSGNNKGHSEDRCLETMPNSTNDHKQFDARVLSTATAIRDSDRLSSPGVATRTSSSSSSSIDVNSSDACIVRQLQEFDTNECAVATPDGGRFNEDSLRRERQNGDRVVNDQSKRSTRARRPDSLNTTFMNTCDVDDIDQNEHSVPLWLDYCDESSLMSGMSSSDVRKASTTSERCSSMSAARRRVTWSDCSATSSLGVWGFTGHWKRIESDDFDSGLVTSSGTATRSKKEAKEFDSTVTSPQSASSSDVLDEKENIINTKPPSMHLESVKFLLTEASGNIEHKKELIADVEKAVGLLVKHCNRSSQNDVQKSLCRHNAQLVRLVISWLCPAIHAVILDGLRPFVHCLFGKVRNSAWNVVEESIKQGPHVIFSSLVAKVKRCQELNTSWLLFNAFIVALINEKALDIWILHLFTHRRRLKLHYESRAIFSSDDELSSSDRQLFVGLLTALRPMSLLPPICLELNCELTVSSANQTVEDRSGQSHVSTTTTRSLMDGACRVMSQWWKGNVAHRGTSSVECLARSVALRASHVVDEVVNLVTSSADCRHNNTVKHRQASVRQHQLSRVELNNTNKMAYPSTSCLDPRAVTPVSDVITFMSRPRYSTTMCDPTVNQIGSSNVRFTGSQCAEESMSCDIPSTCTSRYVETLCHYIATDDRQLSFRKGSCLMVVDRFLDGDWLLCQTIENKQNGFVHCACVKPVLHRPQTVTCVV